MTATLHMLAADVLGLPPHVAMLAGLVLIIGALMWNAARRRVKRTQVEGRVSEHARLHNSRLEAQAKEDINELMVRLEELSREICGQIDTRFAKLERVLVEADRKIAELRALQRHGGAASPSAAGAPAAPPPPPDPRHVAVFERAQGGASPLEIAREMGMNVGEVELVLSLERSRRKLCGAPEEPPAAPEPAPGPADADESPSPRPRRKAKTSRVDERA